MGLIKITIRMEIGSIYYVIVWKKAISTDIYIYIYIYIYSFTFELLTYHNNGLLVTLQDSHFAGHSQLILELMLPVVFKA